MAKRENAEESGISALKDEETETVFTEADGTFEDNMNIQDIDEIEENKEEAEYAKVVNTNQIDFDAGSFSCG